MGSVVWLSNGRWPRPGSEHFIYLFIYFFIWKRTSSIITDRRLLRMNTVRPEPRQRRGRLLCRGETSPPVLQPPSSPPVLVIPANTSKQNKNTNQEKNRHLKNVGSRCAPLPQTPPRPAPPPPLRAFHRNGTGARICTELVTDKLFSGLLGEASRVKVL